MLFILVVGFAFCLILTSCYPKYAKNTPNVLFIITDNWSYPHASMYEDSKVQTSHFDKPFSDELYDVKKDPGQLKNLANDPPYEAIKNQLEEKLMSELSQTDDPRILGGKAVFEDYPFTGGAPIPDFMVRQSHNYATIRIDSFPSKYITPRPIEILIPLHVAYGERFPVLYMYDGQNIFHEFQGWGGELNRGWQVDEVLDSLNRAGTIPKMIVVGMWNGESDRGSEYMPQKPESLVEKRIVETEHPWYQHLKTNPPSSDNYLKFVIEELKPYIDANYKTKPEKEHTFVAGSSMGGLMAAYTICEYPSYFGGAACFSTHWLPLDGVFVEYIKTNLPDPATHKIYFDFGTEGLDAEYEPFQIMADSAMIQAGYEKNKNWMTLKFEGAKHHEDDWRERFHIPLEFLVANQ